MPLDEAGLDEYTDRFTSDAFRHETRTLYTVDSDTPDYARWAAGEDGPDPGEVRPWSRWVRQQRDRNATVRRLRIVYAHPLPEHLRFELGYQYRANISAGEDVRILDLTERPRPQCLIDDEFWMLDGQRVALMTYDHDGRFLHAEAIEGHAARRIRQAADAGWEAGEDFARWWARHPEYHHSRV